MISTKILFSLSIITVFAIASKAKIIKGGDARDIKEREEMVMDDSDRVKSLSWLSNRRFDYENTPEHFITTNKRGMFKIANEKKTEVKPDPVYVNRLKDFIYRADNKSKQKVLYCKLDGDCKSKEECCTGDCEEEDGFKEKQCSNSVGTLIFFK